MPDATELISTTELKSYLGITNSDFDTKLDALKASVETWVKNYCRNPILVATYTEYYDGNGKARQHVLNHPITSITSVHVGSEWNDFTSSTLIATADIIDNDQTKAEGVIELFDAVFTTGVKNVKVIYKAGYSTVPDDMKLAVKIICGRQWLNQDKRLNGIVTHNLGDMNMTVNLEEIPKDAWLILQRYMRPVI